MTAALFIALMLQQAAPAGVVWSDAPPPPTKMQAEVAAPALPDWALADPYAWERAQCSPLVRKDASMEACQTRVRADLAANLGDQLPAELRPSAALENCAPGAAADAYAVQCAPRPITGGAPPPMREQVCDPRPQRQPGGGLAFNSECRPAAGDRREPDGLRIRLSGER